VRNLVYQSKIKEVLFLIEQKNYKDSLNEIEKLITNFPDDFFLENFYGVINLNINNLDVAEKYFNLSIKHNSEFGPSNFNLGKIFYIKKNYDKAIELFLKSLQFDKNNKEIYYNLAQSFVKKQNYEKVLYYLENCLKLDPFYFSCVYLIAWTYHQLKNYEKAILFYNNSLRIKQSEEAYNGLGLIYKELKLIDLALENYHKSLLVNQKYSPAINNIGVALMEKNFFFDAVEYFDQYLNINKKSDVVLSNMAQAQFSILNTAKGSYFFEESLKLQSSVEIYKKYLFYSTYVNNFSRTKYFQLASNFSDQYKKNNNINTYKFDEIKKLRVGFISADFKEHAVSYQIGGILKELKNFQDIEIYAYSNNFYEDKKTEEIKKIFNKWSLVFNLNDKEVAELIIKDQIGILFDLSGYTNESRISVFLHRPSPVQITGFGFLETLGLKEIDYIIADPHVISSEEEKNYTENVLRLPDCWSTLDISDINFLAEETPCLLNNFVTFGVFNNFNKLNLETLDLWSQVLNLIPKSKIFFNNKTFVDKKVKDFLLLNFKKNNISQDRIRIEDGGSRQKILNDYNKIDILLDTYPYGGGTTSLEAAWMCIPILTISGKSFLSKCSSSINLNRNLGDWNCLDKDEYLTKAKLFASDINKLSLIKNSLILNREKNKIFNNKLYTVNFYNLLKNVWQKYLNSKKN
jgi:predicted O-linked N-acetylglucosamine transferase (SPINDLY family)